MKKILVPIDFSESARHALHFAKNLSQRLEAEIEVVFFWHPYFDAADPNRLSPNPELQKLHRKQMEDLVEKENLPIHSGTVLMGFPADSLVEMSKGDEFEMIIMGARGQHGALDRLFGTVSSHVSLHAHCPVLIIPENTPEIHKIDRIIYGLEFPFSTEPSVAQVADLANNLQAEIHFVHIIEEDVSITDEELKKMYSGLQKSLPMGQDYHMVTIIGNDEILKSLEDYAQENQGDMLVLVAREHSWWKRILFPNRTRKLALAANLPLMVLRIEGSANP